MSKGQRHVSVDVDSVRRQVRQEGHGAGEPGGGPGTGKGRGVRPSEPLSGMRRCVPDGGAWSGVIRSPAGPGERQGEDYADAGVSREDRRTSGPWGPLEEFELDRVGRSLEPGAQKRSG